MTYAVAKRRYRNNTSSTNSMYRESMLLRSVIGGRVTLREKFDVGARSGTWRRSPFREIETVVPGIPNEVRNLPTIKGASLQAVFDAVCESIKNSWSPDHFHVVMHSSGYDSRVISGAIKRLVEENGEEWLSPGVLFLSNRWEAAPFWAIMALQGWDESQCAVYKPGRANGHFGPSLEFDTFWHTTNAPTPTSGNLRWYLIEWAQLQGLLPGSEELQVYTGLWANETWNSLLKGGIKEWISRHDRWYCYNQMAALPWKADRVEYPLSGVNVLRHVAGLGRGSGDSWRERLAGIASPETVRIARVGRDDWNHPISTEIIARCRCSYANSWYAKNVKRDWIAPLSSHWSNGWGEYGLASLCEALVRDGVGIQV